MKKYIFSLLAITLIFSGNVFSQTYLDALRFSHQDFEGTARFTSMGGAFGALGGDFTSLSLNPAGIGVYRSSEFTFTPTISYNKAASEYMGLTVNDSRTRFGLSNMGYVGAFLTGREDGLVSFNLGVGYNKIQNYNKNTAMRGSASSSSIMDYFEGKANSDVDFFHPDDFEASDAFRYFGAGDWDVVMAYGTNLIDWNDRDGFYDAHLGPNDKVVQTRYTTQSGSNGEYVFSFGGNVSNRFYFGATFGIQDMTYENIIQYIERGVDGNASDFNNFTYRENMYTTGTGYNAKFGIIYRPTNELRLGLSLHTPTYFYLTDEYLPIMSSQFSQSYLDGPRDPNIYEYRVNSPLRTMGSMAYTFGSVGLLSIDYELINYSGVRMKDPIYRDEFDGENQIIKDNFRATSNVRIGGELRADNFALRAGFIYNQSPDKDYDISKYTYSMGVGYKYNNFFIDAAYAIMNTKDYYSPYSNSPEMITEKETRSRFMLTVGFRF